MVEIAGDPGPLERSLYAVEDPDADLPHPDEQRRTWRPQLLDAILDGTHVPPQPTVGKRTDTIGLFYRGRCHTIASASEAGKTWLALAAVADELDAGNHVIYLDFEDSADGVVGRLLAMLPRPEVIRAQFHYINPEDPIGTGINNDDLARTVLEYAPTLVVLDGITEALSLHGFNPNHNDEVAAFGKILPRKMARLGSAVVSLDHVTKSSENGMRYAIGAVHKLNGLDGAAYVLENKDPFGIGVTGRSQVYLSKDRPGQLRRHGLKGKDGLTWFGTLVVTSHDERFVEVTIEAPHERDISAIAPTGRMQKVVELLTANPAGLSKNAIETMLGGDAKVIRTAIELLSNAGTIRIEPGGRGSHVCHLNSSSVDLGEVR